MRGALVLAVVSTLAACGDDRYGTYFDVRATTKDMQFDRLQFSFGAGTYVEGGKLVPAMPLGDNDPSQDAPPPTPGLLFERAHVDSDDQSFSAARDEFTYYVSSNGDNHELQYLLVQAYLSDVPIGVAESVYFDNPTDAVAIYDLPLHMPDTSIKTWGPAGHQCMRHDIVQDGEKDAIVLAEPNDSDCDGFPDDAGDCAPLIYCDQSTQLHRGCAAPLQCVTPDTTDDACRFSPGRCDNTQTNAMTCATSGSPGDSVCLPAINCQCKTTMGPQAFLECALASAASHPARDLNVPGPSSGHICSPSSVTFEIRDPDTNMVIPCDTPSPAPLAFAYPDGNVPSQQYAFAITAAPDKSTCTIAITPLTAGSNFFPAIPHLLISVSDGHGNRIGFVVGLTANGSVSCDDVTTEIQKNTAAIGSCERP